MDYLAYWYEALASDRGVVFRTNDRERARQKLYSARREACDTSLEVLSIIFSPTSSDEIWIIRNDQTQGSGTPGEGDVEPV